MKNDGTNILLTPLSSWTFEWKILPNRNFARADLWKSNGSGINNTYDNFFLLEVVLVVSCFETKYTQISIGMTNGSDHLAESMPWAPTCFFKEIRLYEPVPVGDVVGLTRFSWSWFWLLVDLVVAFVTLRGTCGWKHT